MKLSTRSLNWALRHVLAHGDTDIFPLPFEYAAINHTWKEEHGLHKWLSMQDISIWTTRPLRRCLAPKHRFAFRLATQLDPLDTLVFLALIRQVGKDLEAKRIPPAADVVHSYRFAPTSAGQLFDPAFSFETFRTTSREHAYSGDWGYVVVADIADFFPRLYFHPLENALHDAAPRHKGEVDAILRLIKSWNQSASYGVPVGSTASRLLAEVAIADVDDYLRSENQTFVRFSDDYRLFCRDRREAYERLSLLAKVLFDNHGLTLERSKTEIVSIEHFRKKYLESPGADERQSLSERFREILEQAGIDDPYGDVDYDDLPEEVQEEIDALNLRGILEEQLGKSDSMDILLTRFVLRRLGQLDDQGSVDLVLARLDDLYAVFKDTVEFLASVRSLNAERKRIVGGELLGLLDAAVVSHLEYHRCWILSIFTENSEWDNGDRFVTVYGQSKGSFTRRKAILAMGRAGAKHWFKAHKKDFTQFPPWERRAFIAAASCLPGDEWDFWYKSVKAQLDPLEKAVAIWAKDNRFGPD